MNSPVKLEYVTRQVIDNQLLVALGDKSKVAVILDADGLKLLMAGLRYLPGGLYEDRVRMIDGLDKLYAAAFSGKEE